MCLLSVTYGVVLSLRELETKERVEKEVPNTPFFSRLIASCKCKPSLRQILQNNGRPPPKKRFLPGLPSWGYGGFGGRFNLGLKEKFFIGPMCTWGPIIGSPCPYNTFLKPCEDLVKTVNVVNVVKT